MDIRGVGSKVIEVHEGRCFKAAGVFGIPKENDRVFTPICQHWQHDAPEEREAKSTWYIAELIQGAWTILFPCKNAIEASDMMKNPQWILDRLAGDDRKWKDAGYRESVALAHGKARKRDPLRWWSSDRAPAKEIEYEKTREGEHGPRIKQANHLDVGAEVGKQVKDHLSTSAEAHS